MKTKTAPRTPEKAYLEYYAAAINAFVEVSTKIHDLPAPDGEIEINWAHVGEMARIAGALGAIVKEGGE